MKNKTVFKTKAELRDWILCSNLFAQSYIYPKEALRQFNKLSSKERIKISRSFSNCDEVRRRNIPKGEDEETFLLSVLVDSHIIATEFNVDPLTAIMCVRPICRSDEKIIVK